MYMEVLIVKKFALGFLTATLLIFFTSYTLAEDKLVSKIYQNALGDVFKVFDKKSNLQAKLGSASGTGDNIGGSLILYNNDESKPRVASGIRDDTDSGAFILYDANGKIRLFLSGEQLDGESGLFLYDENSKCVTAIRESYGYINNQTIVTQDELFYEIKKLQKQIDELKK